MPDERVWNELYPIFNDSIIQESFGSPRWATIRMASEIKEVRKPYRQRPLWNFDLSGLQLTRIQYDELLAFQWAIQGMLNPFLMRNSRNCTFENAKGEPALIGVGDGTTTTFQLQILRPIQGRVNVEYIRFPNYGYNFIYDMNERPWTPMQETSIFLEDDMVLTGLSIGLNTGIINFDDPPDIGVRIFARGGFFTLVVANQDDIPVKPSAAGFVVKSGASFMETIDGV